MSLPQGAQLGPYEIVSPVGAGGMGEVYKARDTRLDRTVAIKVLPPHLADDPQFRERFEREARAISQLTDPHICTIHDVGEHAGRAYLVMEFLEGETLAARLAKSALPLDQALRIAIEISGALDSAHRLGIVHRDVKPANVMLTKSGAKLLDFGLAKHGAGGAGGAGVARGFSPAELTASPTLASPLTQQGTILGTFQYMAPEQIEGQEADARSDIFAFGAMLYEMLTGRKAFEGRTQASLIGAILEREPPAVSSIQSLTPPILDRVVHRCLAKVPDARWQSASDLHEELTWIAEEAPRTTPVVATAGARRRELVAWIVATLAVLAVGAGSIREFRRPAPELPIVRFDVATPATSDPTSFAVSPDGRQLAFVSSADNIPKLWLRPLDQTIAHALAGTENASLPFWAPDSRAIAFFADGKLKRFDLTGGTPQTLVDAQSARGGTWSKDGVIVFAPTTLGPLMRIAASGGQTVAVTQPDQAAPSHRFPEFLPDGRQFLYLAALGAPDKEGVYLGSLDGAPPKRLLTADTAATFASPGYLLLVQQGVLVARPFNVTTKELGEPIPIAQPVGSDAGVRRGAFSVSASGVLAHRSGVAGRRQIVWVDRTGKQVGTVGAPDDAVLQSVALSPNGRRVALSRIVRGNSDIWILDVDRGVPTRFTFDPALDNNPIWSPDSSRVAFRSNRSGPFDLFEKTASGAGVERPVLTSPQIKTPVDWSSDGRFLLYSLLDAKTVQDLWALPMTGDRKPFPVVQTPFTERNGQFSPDGRWIAYDSNESGRFEVSVQPFPGPGGKWQVSTGGGVTPRWRRDGRELFYVAPDGALMAAPVRASSDGQALEPGEPARLFRVPIVLGGSVPDNLKHQYDVAADGQRFLINVTTEEASAVPITVVLNWMTALKK
jgi:serine/threonine protein kinase